MENPARHRIFWKVLLLWGAWLVIIFSLTNGFDYPERFARRAGANLIGFIVIIAVNVKYLFPRFYLRKQHVAYIAAGSLLLAATVLLLYYESLPWSEWFRPQLPVSADAMPAARPGPPGVKWMRELTPLIIAFLGSTLLEITRFNNIREKEKLATELKFLKSQVNPHFLFNALNNIYSLSVVQAPQTPDSVMQLSEILRYMVYDAKEDRVPLKSEINYIQNFVDLQLLKDSRGMNVELDLDESAGHLRVAPLLFIPFVENAFKHSRIEDLAEGFIRIRLRAEEQRITFTVRNSIPQQAYKKDAVGGVGLENTQKRLELLYPDDRHDLTITQTDRQFEVILKIQL